jgi:hypothetical protein
MIYQVGVTGSIEFFLSDGCGRELAPGQSCGITLGIHPTEPGNFEGVLSVSDSAPNSPQRAFLKVIVKD